jgi:peptide/nickel transport system permease protein
MYELSGKTARVDEVPERLEALPPEAASEAPAPPASDLHRVLRTLFRRKTAVAGSVVLSLFVLVAIFAPILMPHDPSQQNLRRRLAPPVGLGLENASLEYPLGNDNLGRDILSRLIYGSRVSLVVGLSTVLLASLIGSLMGAAAGYFGGWFDTLIMRLVDVWMAFPSLLLAIALGAALGQGLFNLVLALVLANWVVYCRVVRGQVLVLRGQEFVEAVRALGGTDLRIIVRHVLPNVLSSILVIASLQLGTVIISEASLSFLGINVESSVPTWGGMLADGRAFMRQAWWLSTLPGIAISLVVLSANLLGDALRDALDPRL